MQSLKIPKGPRNPQGYSKDEILRTLRGIDGSRHWEFRYELLNLNNQKIMDLDDHVESCTISQNFLAQIKRTATFDLRSHGDINFLNDRIKPYARLRMPPQTVDSYENINTGWSNRVEGISGDTVTLESLEATGDPFTSIDYGDKGVVYDDSRNAIGQSSIQVLPPDVGSSNSASLTTERGIFAGTDDTVYFRIYFYLLSDSNMTVDFYNQDVGSNSGMAILVSPTSVRLGNLSEGFVFHNDILSSIQNTWVRLDMKKILSENRQVFEFFWDDIHGSDPNYSFEQTFSEGSSSDQPPHTFKFSSLPDTERPDPYDSYWFDSPSMGTIETVEETVDVTENNYVEWPLGVFLLSSPTRDTDESDVVTRSVEAYDAGKVFQDHKLEDRYTIEKGDNYIEHIDSLLGDVPKVVEPDNTLAARTRDWPVGTEKENLINDITQFINYESLTFDEDGRAVIRPYVLPDERSPEYEYADDEVSVMYPEVSQELDLFDIANKWVITVSNPEQETMKAVLENNNPADPTSIPRRQRTIVDFREEQDVSDRGSLTKKVRRLAWEASREFEAVEFNTAIMPIHSFNDCYTIKYGPLGIDNKYTEHTWDMKLEAGSEMSHRARRVIELNKDSDTSFIEDDAVITGYLQAGNIAAGRVSITGPKDGHPALATITGLDLKGSGEVHAQVTLEGTRPDLLRQASVFAESPNGMKVWATRVDSTTTIDVCWFMMRDL